MELSVKDKELIINAFHKYSAVSVREPFDAYPVVVDPTLLLTRSDYEHVRDNSIIKLNKKYIYFYSCTYTDFEIEFSRRLAKLLGLELIFTHPSGSYCRSDIPEMQSFVSPDIMLRYIQDAEYVIAGSFHATVLSLIHRKKFINLRVQVDKHESRPYVFLKRLKLSQRLVNPATSESEALNNLIADIPEETYSILEGLRSESMNWLRNALINVSQQDA